MVINFDFARNLILKISSYEGFDALTDEDLLDENTPVAKVQAYLDLFIEEELISAKVKTWLDGSKAYEVRYVTLKGKRFSDSLKNPNFWQKYKKKIAQKGINFFADFVEKIIFAEL